MRKLFVASIVAVASLLASPADAGTVTITRDGNSGRIALEAVDATPDQIIAELGRKYGIEIEGQISDAARRIPMTLSWKGRVDQLIARILKTENYVLAGTAASGHAPKRIVLLSARPVAPTGEGGAAAQGLADAGAPGAPTDAASQGAAGTPGDTTANAPSQPEKPAAPAAIDAPELAPGLALASSNALMLAQQFGVNVGSGGAPQAPAPQVNLDAQALTQKVALDAQGLAMSLRSICLGGPSCSSVGK